MGKRVLIIGAGLGGLATALRLAKKGYQVEIIEKNDQAGGRLNQIRKDGFTFDTGPSFFSMSYEFEAFARECGISLPFEYVELDPLYTVSFRNSGKTFRMYKDVKRLAAQFADIEPDFEQKMEDYLAQTGQIFRDTVDLVIKRNFASKLHYLITLARVNPTHIPVLFRSFWTEVQRHFTSPEAQQIVSLVAFFLGRTPFDTMAIYTLLSYTEFRHDGYYNVKGGMYRIVEGLVAELSKAGVNIRYNTEVATHTASNGQIQYFTDRNGARLEADIYVANADAALFRGRILHRKAYSEAKLSRMEWTMGYLTFYIGIDCKLEQIDHHNYYLGSNFKEYADTIMQNPDSLDKPYYYVNVLSRNNAECAPEGCESLFFVCPVPNLLYKKDWSDRDKIVDSIIADFSARIGTDVAAHIVSRTVYTPEDWRDRYGLYQGSGLGLSHSMWQIGAFRPSNRDESYANLFYVGASTAPGAGLPMAIISSQLAAERVEEYSARH